MVPWCRAVLSIVVALAVARATVTVSWNTAGADAAKRATPQAAIQTAIVTAVRGTHVLLRTAGGQTREYIATKQQAQMLQHLLGTAIQFRSTGPRRQSTLPHS